MMILVLAMAAAVANTTPCSASQLSLQTGGEPGDFNGMSHSGTLLVLTNRSGRVCSVPGLPTLVFRDARGRRLDVVRQVPPGMHPGPVVVPVRLAPGASASTPVRWVSGEVYDRSVCLTPRTVEMTIGGRPVRTTLTGRICGQAGRPATVEQPPLKAGDA